MVKDTVMAVPESADVVSSSGERRGEGGDRRSSVVVYDVRRCSTGGRCGDSGKRFCISGGGGGGGGGFGFKLTKAKKAGKEAGAENRGGGEQSDQPSENHIAIRYACSLLAKKERRRGRLHSSLPSSFLPPSFFNLFREKDSRCNHVRRD